MPRLYGLILSGGAGTRLWPRSRRSMPKQFIYLVGERTMLQETADRVGDLIPPERIFVVAPAEHRTLIHEQLPELAPDHLVVEPYPRGNAAAIGLAMAALHAFDPDAAVAVLPSDHVIRKRSAFRDVLVSATAAAELGHLVTLGVEPARPDTGFGYIAAGERLELDAPLPVHAVKRFVEKPSRELASHMVEEGGHYWNAGMFVWRVTAVVEAYRQHLPRTFAAIDALEDAFGTPRYEEVLAAVWGTTERTTIDYGIAEKAGNVAVVPSDIGWHDVGSWARLSEVVSSDGDRPADDQVAHDSHGNFVHVPGKLVALVGVDGLVVVETEDALLVTSKERSEDVKIVVDRLEREGRKELL
ncbi:mannose-1-phosphate guanylyltransferase [soil metagenome]